jgi:hypothetical protein
MCQPSTGCDDGGVEFLLQRALGRQLCQILGDADAALDSKSSNII